MKLTPAAIRWLVILVLFVLPTAPVWAQTNLPATSQTASPAAIDSADNSHHGIPSDLVGMVIALGAFAMIVAIMAIIFYAVYRQKRLLHETVRAMVEKGVPIPPELFSKPGGDWPPNGPPGCDPFKSVFPGTAEPRNDLRTGLLLTGLGVGLVIFIGTPGSIVLFLGLAFILVSFFERKKPGNDQPPRN